MTAWLLWQRAPASDAGTHSASGASEASAAASLQAGDGVQASIDPDSRDVITTGGCWEGLAELDRSATLPELHEALTQALAAGDKTLAGYLREKVAELVGDDPEKALEVIALAEKAGDPVLGHLLDALKTTGAVQRPQVSDRLLALAEDKTALLGNRAAAILALETQHRLPVEKVKRLQAVAMDHALGEVAWTSTRTIGRVMEEDFKRTGTIRPYYDSLLEVGETAEDPAVRKLALEMPIHSEPRLPAEARPRLASMLTTSDDQDVREWAALQLAFTEEPDKALDVYKQAFGKEQEVCVRASILRFAVKAAGPAALPVLEQFAAQDPRFREDLADYKRLFAEGAVDYARILDSIPERYTCNADDREGNY